MLLMLPSCSGITMQQTAFETGQNIGAMRCQQEIDGDCTPRLDYDSYSQARHTLSQGSKTRPDQNLTCGQCATQP